MTDRGPEPENFAAALRAGDRAVLARSITLAESTRDTDRQFTEALLKEILPSTGKSIRIGITGVPGVGKSTFIEKWGALLTSHGHKVAVLTVDPTSEHSRGSILADKTRMDQLSRNPNVFIRPSPSSLALGGVGYRTRESILLCEAAGFDVILVETVGVGQSETDVRHMTDFFLLLMLAGAGDELQGIKKGIMEMADGILITKSDGENLKPVRQALADVTQAMHLQAPREDGWKTKALMISSLEGTGLDEVWAMIQSYQNETTANGSFQAVRQQQSEKWFDECVDALLRQRLTEERMAVLRDAWLRKVREGSLPSEAARSFMTSFLKSF